MITKKKFIRLIQTVVPEDKHNKNKKNKLIYKKINLKYLKEFHRYSIDPRLYEYLGFEPFQSITETKNYLKKLLMRMSLSNEKSAIYWFIFESKSNTLIGTLGLLNISYENNSAEIGFGLDPNYWGKGYIIDILQSIKFYAFNTLELNRIYGSTLKKNFRTINSIKASGMISEGTQKQTIKKNNKYHDTWSYRLLKSEFAKIENINIKNNNKKNINNFKNKDIIDIVSNVLKEKKININSNINNTITWDSLNHFNIFLEISKKYKINFNPEDIANSTSIKKIILNLSKYL